MNGRLADLNVIKEDLIKEIESIYPRTLFQKSDCRIILIMRKWYEFGYGPPWKWKQNKRAKEEWLENEFNKLEKLYKENRKKCNKLEKRLSKVEKLIKDASKTVLEYALQRPEKPVERKR